MSDPPTDAYFKKEVSLAYEGRTLRMRTSDALFSSHDIDDGTRLLLKTLTPDVIAARGRVLDVGCGYGPLGIALAAAGSREVTTVDRDALAVAYTEQNAALNGIESVHAHGSLGYDDVDGEFDLIVSNIPAKAGARVIAHLLLDPCDYLAADGLVAVVVIDAIAAEVEAALCGDTGVEIVLERRAPGYAVFHYRFTRRSSADETDGTNGFARGLYDAEKAPPANALLLDALPRERVGLAIVMNPMPDVVAAIDVERVELIGRDLLWLRRSAGASRGEASIAHVAGVVGGDAAELVVATLVDDEGRAAHEEQVSAMAGRLAAGGAMIVAGSSTAITRVESFVRARKLLRMEGRKKRRGESVLVLRLKGGADA